MEKRIVTKCPKCGEIIGIFAEVEKERVIISALNIDKQTGDFYEPRGRWSIPKERLERDINFLLTSWADIIRVYRMDNSFIGEFKKDSISPPKAKAMGIRNGRTI